MSDFEDELREKIINASAAFKEAVEYQDKDHIRNLHIISKEVNKKIQTNSLKLYESYKHFLISPEKIEINKIEPILVNTDQSSEWSDIFKLIRSTWSMPYNRGFGRRLRYIVYDQYHEAAIGIIGLQSPPADLACRDNLFSYPENRKMELINQTMDIYSLGSIPPYSQLLGGKLVAGLAASKQVCKDYNQKYSKTKTIIENRQLDSQLIALTTTSAFGRSSIYNRLKYKNRLLAEPIGYTKGYGSIHLEPYYADIRRFLEEREAYHYGGYGKGPKQKWQNIHRALTLLNISHNHVKHGINREVFLYRLVDDLETGMAGGDFGRSIAINSKEFSKYWLERWAIPRAHRKPEWKEVSTADYFKSTLESQMNI